MGVEITALYLKIIIYDNIQEFLNNFSREVPIQGYMTSLKFFFSNTELKFCNFPNFNTPNKIPYLNNSILEDKISSIKPYKIRALYIMLNKLMNLIIMKVK